IVSLRRMRAQPSLRQQPVVKVPASHRGWRGAPGSPPRVFQRGGVERGCISRASLEREPFRRAEDNREGVSRTSLERAPFRRAEDNRESFRGRARWSARLLGVRKIIAKASGGHLVGARAFQASGR